jgi:hypothetical protein
VTGSSILDAVADEIERQDGRDRGGYPATRDDIRLGIAAAEDELAETLTAWRDARCKCPTPGCDHADWSEVRIEASQAAAVLLRLAREIPHD